ncbi:unnamed protein product [Peniophora sp. CBMAI 1063]|nr:unnamed protein product [Peniophora sp. CBMAI 1063]
MARGKGSSGPGGPSKRRGASAHGSTPMRGRSAGQSDAPPDAGGSARSASAPRRSTRLANPPAGGAPASANTTDREEPRRRTRSLTARKMSTTSGPSSSAIPSVAGPSPPARVEEPHSSLSAADSSSTATGTTLPRTPRKPDAVSGGPIEFDSTPVSLKSDPKLALNAEGERGRNEIYLEHCQMAEGMWVGPVPDVGFLDKCVPDDNPSRSPRALQALARKVFANVPEKNGEAAFFDAIVKSGVCKNLQPLDTHSFRVPDGNSKLKYGPDFFLVLALLASGLLKKGVLRQRTGISAGIVFGDQKQTHEDPARGLDGTVPLAHGAIQGDTVQTHDAQSMRLSRGQLLVYPVVMMSNSHRTKVLAFVLVGDDARLFIFDHSGIIYSSLFNWRKTGILLAFLARIDAMTEAQYGWDTSVELIRTVQWARPDVGEKRDWLSSCVVDAKKLLKATDALPAGMTAESLFPSRGKHGPYALFHQYNPDARTIHRIIAFQPIDYEDTGLIGSNGRWWIGVDLTAKTVVYFKDYWRVDLPDIPAETDTYKTLQAAGVPHVLKLHFGSDVPNDTPGLVKKCNMSEEKHEGDRLSEDDHDAIEYQTTFTYKFAQANDEFRRRSSDVGGVDDDLLEMLPRTHHRIFFTTIPAKITDFTSTRQLVECVSHALLAHQQAYESAGILHRGIDAFSIMFDKAGCGYLCNWERSKSLQELFRRMKSRKGNLQFLAVDILQNPRNPHSLRHDVESFVHLLHYVVLRYRPIAITDDAPTHLDPRTELLEDMRAVFDSCTVNSLNTLVTAAKGKTTFLNDLNGQFLSASNVAKWIAHPPLARLLFDMRRLFAGVYTSPPAPFPDPKPRDIAKYNQQHASWAAAVSKAAKKLTTRALLKLFTDALASDDWPQHDGATDQYPPPARPPSGASKASGGNPARTFLDSLTGTKRPRTYSTGTGSLPAREAPSKRQRLNDGSSRLEDDEEPQAEALCGFEADKALWTLEAHCH